MGIEYTSQSAFRSGIYTTNGGSILPNTNLSRRSLIVQNLGTASLYVKFGTGATITDFDIILKGGVVNDDGTGGTFSEDILSYQGVVSVAGVSGVRAIATAF